MDPLTEYLQGAYGEQRASVENLRALAGAGLRTLSAHARPDGTWPRELVDGAAGDPPPAGPRGRLTVLAILAAVAGRLPANPLLGAGLAGGRPADAATAA